MFDSQDTPVHRQSASINIPKDTAVDYQKVDKKTETQQPAASQAFVITEIENRPLVNFNIPHHPPLQTVYPASIQNNVVSRAAPNRPTVQRYSSPPIPQSLPSIVHEPSNTVATIQNVPVSLASSLNAQHYQYPVITSRWSNRESYQNAQAREKVVVKVVKAPGWYLNDANERRSYFDAVARGLLSENGLVYVNNVQRENAAAAHFAQQTPNSFTPTKIDSTATFSQYPSSPIQDPSVVYSPQNIIPSAVQSTAVYPAANLIQSYNGINYWPPCAIASYQQHVQDSQSSIQPQAQSRQLSFDKPTNIEDNLYSGRSSYNVEQKSVGRLAGDNAKYQYNLSSIHQPTQHTK